MTGPAQGPFLGAVERVLSTERLGTYRLPGGDERDAYARYLWNVDLCRALYPVLHYVEVALRNRIDAAVSAARPIRGCVDVPSWLDADPPILLGREAAKVGEAKAKLVSAGSGLTPGKLVAELPFGFWTSLFHRPYEDTRHPAQFWPSLLTSVFPALPRPLRSRKVMSPRLVRVRDLRNRVFHHEPVWRQALAQDHAAALDLLGWLSPELRRLAERTDPFPAVYAAGIAPLRAAVDDLLGGAAPRSSLGPEAP